MHTGLESSLARMHTAVLYVGMGAGISTKRLQVIWFCCALSAHVVFGRGTCDTHGSRASVRGVGHMR